MPCIASRRRLVRLGLVSLLCFVVLAAAPVSARVIRYYESATYGYGLAFDPAAWTVTTDSVNTGYDLGVLTNGTTEVVLEGAPNAARDAAACVYDEIRRLSQRADVADLIVSQEGTYVNGDFTGQGLSYSYIRNAGGTGAYLAAATKWCAILPGGGSLVITQISPFRSPATASLAAANLLRGLHG